MRYSKEVAGKTEKTFSSIMINSYLTKYAPDDIDLDRIC